jgi:hypothetical protein
MGSHNLMRPGMFVLRAGTLDDSSVLERVALHCFTRSRQPWLERACDAPEFSGAPRI